MPERVLIVEDNEKNLKLFQLLVKSMGCETLTAASGEEAFMVLESIPSPPDLVLMDIQLPGMDGIEIMKRIRKMPCCETLTVIALTSFAMKGDREKLMEEGFDEYISKPIEKEVFFGILRKFLKEAK